MKHARRVCVYPAPDRPTDGRLRGGCCVLCLSGSSGHFWLLAPLTLLLLLECLMVAAGNESVCDKLELIIIIIKKKRHTKATPAVRREASPSGSRCCICVRRTRRRFLIFLCLWHWKECEEGGTDGWKDGGGGGGEGVLGFFVRPPPPPHHHSLYLESLLMTRISAPFSSFRRWLSARRSTRTWRWSWGGGKKKKRCTQIKNSGLNFIKVPHRPNMRVIK